MNLLTRQTDWWIALGIFCCGLALFSVGLSHQEIIGFESRFYLFAQEMWRHGITWFPTTYGNYYPDYPVTSTLMIYGVAKITGQLNKFSAIFPSAIAASVTLAVTYLIAVLHDRRLGLFAVFFLLLTNMFVVEARTISPDQYVAMVTAIAFYLIYSAKLTLQTKRLWFIPLLLMIGFAVRGPIGLVIPAGVICVFYLLDKNIKQFFVMGGLACITLVICAAILFACAYRVGGMVFVQDVLRMQVVGRLDGATQPWYFYFSESLGAYALSYPLAILVMLGFSSILVKRGITVEQKFLIKLAGWVLIVIIGLSIPAGKKIRYLLTFAPPLALLSATIFVGAPQNLYFVILRRILTGILGLFPAVGFFVVAYVAYFGIAKMVLAEFHDLLLMSIFSCLQIVSLIFSRRDGVVVGIAALAFVVLVITVLEPINMALNKTREFVEKIEISRHLLHVPLAFYLENRDAMPIKYIINMPVPEQPVFITAKDALPEFKSPAFIIMDPNHYRQLAPAIARQLHLIATGKVGRDVIVVVQRDVQ
jgi:4-amino-4-deoxy-L-arabinose transferase-like glycosyltransferase